MAPKKDPAGSVKSPVEAVPASQSSGKAPTALESKRVELERRLSLVSSELTDDEVAAVMGRFEPSKLIHDFNKVHRGTMHFAAFYARGLFAHRFYTWRSSFAASDVQLGEGSQHGDTD